jgi:hypothetical protein
VVERDARQETTMSVIQLIGETRDGAEVVLLETTSYQEAVAARTRVLDDQDLHDDDLFDDVTLRTVQAA